jgi:hypothetical protein
METVVSGPPTQRRQQHASEPVLQGTSSWARFSYMLASRVGKNVGKHVGIADIPLPAHVASRRFFVSKYAYTYSARLALFVCAMARFIAKSGAVALSVARRGPRETLVAGTATAGMIVLMNTLTPVEPKIAEQSSSATVIPPPSTIWQPIAKPHKVFALAAPEIEKLSQTYQAWRHMAMGLLEDRLGIGHFADGGMHAQMSVFRTFSSSPHADASSFLTRSFYLDLVRSSSQNGLGILRIARTEMMDAKFGSLETADILLSDGGIERSCLAYRHISTDSQLRFNGWLCGPTEQPVSRPILGCFIDRLTLMMAGEDKTLRQTFANAELKRNPACLSTKMANTTPAKGHWLDMASVVPELKKEPVKKETRVKNP